ncbi:peptidoglycan-binding protein [Erwinia phyllosphaerae]|uniref:peptidoglycan-binding protein n=1 Tax=Erwinia phyllosphaerae TaxID=2853256 RepID=UPI001FED4780|nr:peptidoglycan-binding protein [Erwinia phyllosphaerae]MBV4368228.1 peptidoglycan-binding protein [Erwinia phyllosphaerae]
MSITGSVGLGGVNRPADVKLIQELLQKNGFPRLKNDGRMGPETLNSINKYQMRFMRKADGIINVHGLTFNNLVSKKYSAPIPGKQLQPPKFIDDHPVAGPLQVPNGQVTFDAEGNDIPGNHNFSRWIQWPGKAGSGVTIGRGYDIGGRSEGAAFFDLSRAGIPENQARQIASGHGKKGVQARDFVHQYREVIGTISHQMQIKLFNLIYPQYVKSAEVNYNGYTMDEPGRVAWNQLNPAIRDIMVDFVYQGFTKGPNPMIAGMTNNFDTLINYILTNPVMNSFEPGRRRVPYLRKHRP